MKGPEAFNRVDRGVFKLGSYLQGDDVHVKKKWQLKRIKCCA